jgi:hypothetical protein
MAPSGFKPPVFWRGCNGKWFRQVANPGVERENYLTFYDCVKMPHIPNGPCSVKLHVSLIEKDDYGAYIPVESQIWYEPVTEIQNICLESAFLYQKSLDFDFKQAKSLAEVVIPMHQYGENS